MTVDKSIQLNPAEKAAKRALDQVFECICNETNFRLEAGAGAGKTYSLVQALNFIISKSGGELLKLNQQVACISYTNVATDEIASRIDRHPAVLSSTIHAFCWLLIKNFQPYLKTKLVEIEKWAEILDEFEDITKWKVEYQLGRRKAIPEESCISLGHDDVILLTVFLMEEKKFRDIFASRFPILFIDEYQDTNKNFADSIVKHFISEKTGPLIGLFGDSWQKIYGDGCGLIEHENLKHIGKEANFRSVKTIVNVLNKIRPDLPQEVQDPDSTGFVRVFHTNNWKGARLTGQPWKDDLPADISHEYLDLFCRILEDKGWKFSPETTKILMLTHNVLAKEQKYDGIANTFRYNDSFIKKENPYISFLVEIIEPMCETYLQGKFGEMLSVLGIRSMSITSKNDKDEWTNYMSSLLPIRENGTIGEMIKYIVSKGRPEIPDAIADIEKMIAQLSEEEINETRILTEAIKLKRVQYQEIIALAKFLNQHTPFSTKHGVKGAEFENVLVVFGRGWNQYNWNNFLEFSQGRIPNDKEIFYERNRNLFYVSCSRPKIRLALLFTQKLSEEALMTLAEWFGNDAIQSI